MSFKGESIDPDRGSNGIPVCDCGGGGHILIISY